MTAREYLEEIRSIDLQLRVKESELEKTRQDIYCLSATDYSKDKISGGRPMDLSDKIAKLDALREEINNDWDRLIDERKKAKVLIQKIRDHRYISVLIERYVNAKEWEQIAKCLDYSKVGLYTLHRIALKKFDEVYSEV